jgi:hypothetical protein
MTLFHRTWRVTVGELRVSKPMRVAFEIERTLRPQPNKATVRLWNLTRDHQAQIEGARTGQVVIEAGYEQDAGLRQLFRGTLFRARGNQSPTIKSERDGTDVVTYVEARDGGRAYQRARISQSFEPGVAVTTVIKACADALGIGAGNLNELAPHARFITGDTTYPEGTVLSGQASRELTRLLHALGLRWSVQHEQLQILRRGQPLQTTAVRLSSSTGLVGSPEAGSRGRATVRALLTPELWPGRIVELRSERLEGRFSVRAVTYTGDSHGDDWLAECQLAQETVATAP